MRAPRKFCIIAQKLLCYGFLNLRKPQLTTSGKMNPADRLLRLFQYDDWANRKIRSALVEAPGTKELVEAFRMYAHLASAQQAWYARISGEESDRPLWPEMGLDESREVLESLAPRWRQLLREEREGLDRVVSYTNSKGTAYNTMLADILHHVIIHGQHHRAQIARFLRRTGYQPPATDFIYYVRETDG